MMQIEDFYVTLTFNIVAILIILGLCMTPKNTGEKNNPGAKIFMGMGISIIVGAVLDIIVYSGLNTKYRFLVLGVPTLSEIAAISFMFFLLLYTDFVFFGSRDHLRRHFIAYLAPFAFITVIDIINSFTGIMYKTADDLVLTPTPIYYIVGIIESLYFFIPAGYFLWCFVKFGKPRFFHPLSICIPIVCGVVISMISPFSVHFLGMAAGLAFLVFSRIDSWRFIDIETGFYNRAYLEYVLKMIADKKGTFKGMIVADIAGDRIAFSKVLKEELPSESEVVIPDKGSFVYLADTGNMTELDALASLIGLGAEEYDEDHPDRILFRGAVCSSFKDDEAIQAAIRTLKQRINSGSETGRDQI